MNKYKFVFFVLLSFSIFLTAQASGGNFAVLNPKGAIAEHERNLAVMATLLMLIVVIPVYILLFVFARKYRAGNPKAKYAPNLSNDAIARLMWAIPSVIIFVIAIINWKSTHALDPYKPLVSDQKPLTIQVVALQWKWLFIYPEQNIATVNYIRFPERTPIHFELTADAPINSFWIPQLGGQMYAMAGMKTQLNLIANETGEFRGSAAEINGVGFAGMHFIARATSKADFDQWVQSLKQSPATLTLEAYNKLAEPSKDNLLLFYASVEKGLYNSVMMKFMPASVEGAANKPTNDSESASMPGTQM